MAAKFTIAILLTHSTNALLHVEVCHQMVSHNGVFWSM